MNDVKNKIKFCLWPRWVWSMLTLSVMPRLKFGYSLFLLNFRDNSVLVHCVWQDCLMNTRSYIGFLSGLNFYSDDRLICVCGLTCSWSFHRGNYGCFIRQGFWLWCSARGWTGCNCRGCTLCWAFGGFSCLLVFGTNWFSGLLVYGLLTKWYFFNTFGTEQLVCC